MTEKVFRVFSNCDEHLTADIMAMALLRYVTLNNGKTNVSFAVKELTDDNNSLNVYEECALTKEEKHC